LVPRLREDLNLRVWVADDPLTCVARGAGMVLENLSTYEKFLVSLDRIRS
jgi:rod shape-determining protein MreB